MTPAARPRLLTGPVVRLFTADFAAMISFYLLLSVVPLLPPPTAASGQQAGSLHRGVDVHRGGSGTATPALAARLGISGGC